MFSPYNKEREKAQSFACLETNQKALMLTIVTRSQEWQISAPILLVKIPAKWGQREGSWLRWDWPPQSVNKCTILQEEKSYSIYCIEQDRSVGISNYAKILDNVEMCLMCLALQKHVFCLNV